MSKRYLFYVSQNYSFEILRPIQKVIWARGDDCAWFVEGSEVSDHYFSANEKRLNSVADAINYNPLAVLVPGNVVPNFIPGLKVQVFHGLEYKKKGHFGIRGFFDLYCTQGPYTTKPFQALAEQHQFFSVAETGWSKLDPLFTTEAYPVETDKPIVLFAPTFSPNLTCAIECLEAIKTEVNSGRYYWLAKFHPKMNPDWIALYQAIESDHFRVIETDSALPLLQTADVMFSDTSSMIGEFSLLDKPVVSFKNSDPGDYLIDIDSADKLTTSLQFALSRNSDLIERIKKNNLKLHPFTDGRSSERILDAIELRKKSDDEAAGNSMKKRKPLNWFRSYKLRKKLNYWNF